jgi:hypothetical protein
LASRDRAIKGRDAQQFSVLSFFRAVEISAALFLMRR